MSSYKVENILAFAANKPPCTAICIFLHFAFCIFAYLHIFGFFIFIFSILLFYYKSQNIYSKFNRELFSSIGNFLKNYKSYKAYYHVFSSLCQQTKVNTLKNIPQFLDSRSYHIPLCRWTNLNHLSQLFFRNTRSHVTHQPPSHPPKVSYDTHFVILHRSVNLTKHVFTPPIRLLCLWAALVTGPCKKTADTRLPPLG